MYLNRPHLLKQWECCCDAILNYLQIFYDYINITANGRYVINATFNMFSTVNKGLVLFCFTASDIPLWLIYPWMQCSFSNSEKNHKDCIWKQSTWKYNKIPTLYVLHGMYAVWHYWQHGHNKVRFHISPKSVCVDSPTTFHGKQFCKMSCI